MGLRCIPVWVLVTACASTPSLGARAPSARPPAARSTLTLGDAPESGQNVERIFALSQSDTAPKRGGVGAKVTVLVCSDFECPFCARLKPTLDELETSYGDLVRIEWRHCPLPFHEHAVPASEAAVEVFAQAGDRGFWAFHDVLFEHQDALGAASLVRYAGEIAGVDGSKVAEALADHRHLARVAGDLRTITETGAASGGFGTPATFINGRLIAGAQPYEAFEAAVERALQESPDARAQAEARSQAAYPMVRVRHILIQWRGVRGAAPTVTRTQQEARALAQKLRDEIVLRGGDMAELARLNSDCPSAPDGGALGRFTRGELVPNFERVMFALEAGQLSDVVETPFGYHVILRED